MSTITHQIIQKIRVKRRGWTFCPKDFLDIASRGAVDNVLSRLTKRGIIRRIDKGIYDFPKISPMVGVLSPHPDDVATAVARKTGHKAFPSGAMSANLLGLSTQVPAKPVYLTNGPSTTKKLGNRTVMLKHARVPLMDHLSFEANLALQAMAYIGKDHLDHAMIDSCASKLSPKDIRSLSKATAFVPVWMVRAIHQLPHPTHG